MKLLGTVQSTIRYNAVELYLKSGRCVHWTHIVKCLYHSASAVLQAGSCSCIRRGTLPDSSVSTSIARFLDPCMGISAAVGLQVLQGQPSQSSNMLLLRRLLASFVQL